MPETVQQYVARIQSYVQDHDFLEVLAATPARLRSLVANVSDSQLRQRPAPQRWSIMEQVAHLADVEIVIGYRTRSILGGIEGAPIIAYDQDAWQQAMRYNDGEIAPTLEAFNAARENNLRLYRTLTDAEWDRYGIHSERGRESVRDTVRLNAGHDINHLRQIEAILARSAAAS